MDNIDLRQTKNKKASASSRIRSARLRSWSALVDQQKVDRLTCPNVIFDSLEPPAFQNMAFIGSFKHSFFFCVFVTNLSLCH